MQQFNGLAYYFVVQNGFFEYNKNGQGWNIGFTPDLLKYFQIKNETMFYINVKWLNFDFFQIKKQQDIRKTF